MYISFQSTIQDILAMMTKLVYVNIFYENGDNVGKGDNVENSINVDNCENWRILCIVYCIVTPVPQTMVKMLVMVAVKSGNFGNSGNFDIDGNFGNEWYIAIVAIFTTVAILAIYDIHGNGGNSDNV